MRADELVGCGGAVGEGIEDSGPAASGAALSTSASGPDSGSAVMIPAGLALGGGTGGGAAGTDGAASGTPGAETRAASAPASSVGAEGSTAPASRLPNVPAPSVGSTVSMDDVRGKAKTAAPFVKRSPASSG